MASGRVDVLRVTGSTMAPTVPAGSYVMVDGVRVPRPGDLVVARKERRLHVGLVGEWGGARWLLTLRGGPPVELAALVGVVTHVLESAPT